MYMAHARGAMRRNSHSIEKKQNDTRGLLVPAPLSLPCMLTSDVMMLSVVGMSVEFALGARSTSLSLVRMALFRVSKATENKTIAIGKLLSETPMGLYWMMSGL